MFGKTIWLPKCLVTSSRCENLILLHFYLQMLNDINVENSLDSLRCKYQPQQITKTREKNVSTNENCILRKMGLKFQNPSFNWMYSCHVTYAFQSESTLYSCLNVKELPWSRCKVWSLSDYNWTWTRNHLVHKRTLRELSKTFYAK